MNGYCGIYKCLWCKESHLFNFIYLFKNKPKETKMKVRVKKDLVIVDPNFAFVTHRELKAGVYDFDYERAVVSGIILPRDFVNNSEFFEIIEDAWKPNPYRLPGYLNAKGLFTKKELALRKLRQIADHLNEGWKPDWENSNTSKCYIYYDWGNRMWGYGSDLTWQSQNIYFKEMNDEILAQIIIWMNNGDGVCMNDLLEN
ncbi:MAG: hypothetical protein WC549_02085 [Actinomycetota bacterium]